MSTPRRATTGAIALLLGFGLAADAGGRRLAEPDLSGATPFRFVGTGSALPGDTPLVSDGHRYAFFTRPGGQRMRVYDTMRRIAFGFTSRCSQTALTRGAFLLECHEPTGALHRVLDADRRSMRAIPNALVGDTFVAIGRRWVEGRTGPGEAGSADRLLFVNWHTGERVTLEDAPRVCAYDLDAARPRPSRGPCDSGGAQREGRLRLRAAGALVLSDGRRSVRLTDRDCSSAPCDALLSADWVTWKGAERGRTGWVQAYQPQSRTRSTWTLHDLPRAPAFFRRRRVLVTHTRQALLVGVVSRTTGAGSLEQPLAYRIYVADRPRASASRRTAGRTP